jgi:hypothetical protein
MVNLYRLPPMLPRILPKQRLPRVNRLFGIVTQRLLPAPFLLQPQTAIAMVPAVGRQLPDLGVAVGVQVGDVPGQAVAHDERLRVGREPDAGDAAVERQDVPVALVQDELAGREGGALEGGLGAAGRGVDGGARARPAGVRSGRPLQVLEGYVQAEAVGGRGAVGEDLLRGGGVGREGRVGAAKGERVEGVVGVGAAFLRGGRGGGEGAGGVGGDLGVGGGDLVEDREAVLGWVVGGDVGA